MNDTTPLQQAAPRAPCPASGLPRAICQFTPNWFTVTMGTGVLALALNQFPVPDPDLHQVLHQAGRALWMVNIGLFTLFTLLYAARWVFFFSGAQRVLQHSVASMFFGAIPMGLATIVNGILAFGIPLWGDAAVAVAYPLWWVDVALSLASGLLVPFLMFTQQDHSMENMTGVWLIPIVAAEVAAASGGVLIPHLPAGDAFGVLIISYALWAFSVPLAMSILVILLLRLFLHKLPDRNMAASGWLALGPIGTGSLGLLLLGGDAPATFAAAGIPGRRRRGFRHRHHWRHDPLGLRRVVADAGRAQDGPVLPRRHAVQPRLVGVHLPARRLYAGHPGAGARHASRILLRRGRAAGGVPRGLLAPGRGADPARGVVRLPLRGALPDGAAGPNGRRSGIEGSPAFIAP